MLKRVGEYSPHHKYTEEQIRKVKELYKIGYGYKKIANMLGYISYTYVRDIIKGKYWNHVK